MSIGTAAAVASTTTDESATLCPGGDVSATEATQASVANTVAKISRKGWEVGRVLRGTRCTGRRRGRWTKTDTERTVMHLGRVPELT